MRAPVETMIKSNRCSEESITTRELDHLDHLVVLFVYLHTPRFRSLRTERKKKGKHVRHPTKAMFQDHGCGRGNALIT